MMAIILFLGEWIKTKLKRKLEMRLKNEIL